jgi:hypothetical protein
MTATRLADHIPATSQSSVQPFFHEPADAFRAGCRESECKTGEVRITETFVNGRRKQEGRHFSPGSRNAEAATTKRTAHVGSREARRAGPGIAAAMDWRRRPVE